MGNKLTDLSISRLSKYIFGELPEEELAAIERSIAEDDYYFRIVENLLDYCERKNILSHQGLEMAFAKEREKIFEEVDALKEQRETERASKREVALEEENSVFQEQSLRRGRHNFISDFRWLIPILIMLMLAILLYVFFPENEQINNSPQEPEKSEQVEEQLPDKTPENTPQENPGTVPEIKEPDTQKARERGKEEMASVILPKPESKAILGAIQLREKISLRTAGDNNWQSAFVNNNMSTARQLLDQEIQNHPPENVLKIHWYLAGVMHLYHEGGNLQKAIDYLENAGKSIRPDIQLHLINAYAKNKDIAKAKEILKEEPQWEKKLPSSVKALLEK
jgi:Tetratricopeptide repeat